METITIRQKTEREFTILANPKQAGEINEKLTKDGANSRIQDGCIVVHDISGNSLEAKIETLGYEFECDYPDHTKKYTRK